MATKPKNSLMAAMQAFALGTILLGFFAILVLLFFKEITPGSKDLIAAMIEVLKNVLLIAVGFVFGAAVANGTAPASHTPAPPAPAPAEPAP